MSNKWQEIREEAVFCIEDGVEEMLDDPISSEDEEEDCYDFEKDEKVNEWLANLFEEAEKQQLVPSLVKTLVEATSKITMEVYENSGYKL